MNGFNYLINCCDKSTLVRVMAWCLHTTSHWLNQYWLWSLSPHRFPMPQGVNMRRCIGSAVSGERAHWRLHELFDRGTNRCGIKSLMLRVIHLGIATSSYLHRCDISAWNICSFRYLDFRCLRGILVTHAFEGILLFSLMLKIIPLPRVSFGVFWRHVEYSTHPFICSAQMFPRRRYKVTLGSLLAHNWYDVVEVYVCRPYHICI